MNKNKRNHTREGTAGGWGSRPSSGSHASRSSSNKNSARGNARSSSASLQNKRGPAPGAAKPQAKPGRTGNGRDQASQYTVHESMELLPFLLLKLSSMGRNSVKSVLARGQVSVGEQVTTEYNRMLAPGQIVTVRRERVVERPPLIGLSILHEDDAIIIVHKDSGLLSIASDKEEELTAYRQLMAHVRAGDPQGRVFVVHRLDRDTSGVMMFAKSELVQQALQQDWQEAIQERTYVALVEGQVKKPEGKISSWLKESKTLKMYSSPYPNDGQHAVTHYKTLQSNRQFSLLEIQLETGRKNQIRVHMEDIGHPIVGDKKYGSKSKQLNRLGLHARVLAFTHPVTGEPMRFETPIPKAFLYPFKQPEGQ